MAKRPIRLTLMFSISIIFALAAQSAGISISTTSSAAGETATSWESFALDDSTSLQESMVLASGGISMNRQAEGKGNNSLTQTISGAGYALHNDIESQGEFSAVTASSASAQSANLDQNVKGAGSLGLELQGIKGPTDAVLQAGVKEGILASQHSLSAGEGVTASQSTLIEGQEGSVLSGALGKDNVMVAKGSFDGQGVLKADLDSSTLSRASTGGRASVDGVSVLNEDTFKTVSQNEKTMGMEMSGLRMVQGGLGNFEVSIVDLNFIDQPGISYADEKDDSDAIKSKGSASSYALTGFRWNQKDPNIQLYLNPTDIPSGIKEKSARDAISAAVNTWDSAVDQNLFADGSPVIIDYNKKVVNPASGNYWPDGYNVNGFLNLDNDYLAVTTCWTDLTQKDGYFSLVESDIVYNLDFKWTDSEKQAKNTGKLDLQSVALHELGHVIGLQDLYILEAGDERKYDLDQVMNLYNGPQRTLGNGDLAGVEKLYGAIDLGNLLRSKIGVLRNGEWYLDGNGNGMWDQDDVLSFFGTEGDLPIIGDWNGDGKNKIGVLRNGEWYLDYNGNGMWDQDDMLSFFGTEGDRPIIGDWNGDGRDDMGVLRDSEWYLDYNGNGVWDSEDILSSSFALTGDLPVTGDWNGDGRDKVGVLRDGEWYLDYNGNGVWDSDDIFSNLFGTNGDLPVAGDWNGDGRDKIGVLRDGEWYLDYNGNGMWDSDDIIRFFGTKGDQPVAEYWN